MSKMLWMKTEYLPNYPLANKAKENTSKTREKNSDNAVKYYGHIQWSSVTRYFLSSFCGEKTLNESAKMDYKSWGE